MRLAMNGHRKQRISDAFGAAAARYDDHAGPQRLAAALVADLAQRQKPAGVERILEIGCGPGFLQRAIQARWPGAELVATALSPDMLATASAGGFVGGTFLPVGGGLSAVGGE